MCNSHKVNLIELPITLLGPFNSVPGEDEVGCDRVKLHLEDLFGPWSKRILRTWLM
jgi:hypothetical protein